MVGKVHQKRKAGRKAEKRKAAETKKKGGAGADGDGGGGDKAAAAANKGQNPKAFAFQSAGKARASRARTAEKEQRRLHGERAGPWRGGLGDWAGRAGPPTPLHRDPLAASRPGPSISTTLHQPPAIHPQ